MLQSHSSTKMLPYSTFDAPLKMYKEDTETEREGEDVD